MIHGGKKVNLLIILIVISLAGLITIQGYLLKDAVQSREQTFNNNVAAALNLASEVIQAQNAVSMIIGVSGDADGIDSLSVSVDTGDSLLNNEIETSLIVYNKDTVLTGDSVLDSAAIRSFFRDSLVDSICYTQKCKSDSFKLEHDRLELNTTAECEGNIIRVITAASNDRAGFIQKVLDRMWISEVIPIESRLDSALIDSSISRSLADVHIDLEYVFGVSVPEKDMLLYAPKEHTDDLLKSNYKIRLFPLDIISDKAELLLYFPERQVYLWKQILPMLVIIGIFILVIVVTFIFTIKVIINQKQNEIMIADFINNMTHEFKTPISTIALATEAILRDDVISDNEKVSRFSKMILDENKRMRYQAEKILHMASMENGDIKLNPDSVDIHEVIRESVENISLYVKKQDGSIRFEDKADNYVIRGDRIHLSGVISNLLDNAVKYSPQKPDVNVMTLNADRGIYIKVSDNGIGINKSDIKMVFNKYFRVSSGNVHDVKGFGLGLSYVKMIVEAHGGTVSIKSRPGIGTSIEIYLPLEKIR